MLRRICFFLLLCFLLLGVSCLPEFKNPPIPDEFQIDGTILGTWYGENGNDRQQLSIFPRPDGWLDFVFVYHINNEVKSDGLDVLVFEGYNMKISTKDIICFRGRTPYTGPEAEVQGWALAAYKLSGRRSGVLEVKLFSAERAKGLIKAGKLKGQTEEGFAGFDSVAITSSAEELMEVMLQDGIDSFVGGEIIYAKPMIFTRESFKFDLAE